MTQEKQTGSQDGERIVIRRVRKPRDGEGLRVLVDRLWPRGVSKERADLDLWAKDATPSTELRKAFHGGQLSFADFSTAYRRELQASDGLGELLDAVRDALRGGQGEVALLIAADPAKHNHAEVLRAVVLERLSGG